MLPYWLLFICVALAALFYGEPKQRPSILVASSAVAISLLVGFRFHVGGDWYNYLAIYRGINSRSLWDALFFQNSEPAYSLLNWISSRAGAGVWLPNLVCGALLMWGINQLALRQPNPWLVYVVAVPYLIIVVGMGYTRQAAAIGLVLIAINAAADQKLAKFIAAAIAAALFHKSAVIMLPILGLSLSKNRFITAILIAAISVFLYIYLIRAQINLMTYNYVQQSLQSSGAVQRILMNAIPAGLYLLRPSRFGFLPQERLVWRNIAIASLVALAALILLRASTAIDRLALYFTGIQLVIFARLPWALGGQGWGRPLILLLVIAVYAAVMLTWLNFADNARFWIPYRLGI